MNANVTSPPIDFAITIPLLMNVGAQVQLMRNHMCQAIEVADLRAECKVFLACCFIKDIPSAGLNTNVMIGQVPRQPANGCPSQWLVFL